MLSDIPDSIGEGEPLITFTLEEGTLANGNASTTTVSGTTVSGSVVVGSCTVDGTLVTCPISTAMNGDSFNITATSNNGLTVLGQPKTVNVVL